MALKDLLDLSTQHKKIGISEERIEAVMPILRKYIAFWREYPDLFVDFMVRGQQQKDEQKSDSDEAEEKKYFRFYFYQRVKNSPLNS